MSNQSGSFGAKPQGASRGNFQNSPGLQNVRPAPDEAKFSLVKAMGQGYRKLGDELMKGPAADPTEVAKAQAMIKQAVIASRGAQSPQAGQPAPTGGPRPVDGQIDPISGAPMGGQGQGQNTQPV